MESSWMPLTIAVVLPYTVPTIEVFAMLDSLQNWYPKLIKAPWNPPSWLFGLAVLATYGMMGYASFLIWREGEISASTKVNEKVRVALIAYGIQLFLNWLWSPLFFNLHLIGLSILEQFLLLLAIAYAILEFRPVNHLAAYLMIPCLLWETYGTTLTIYMWVYNDADGPIKEL